MVNSRYSDFKEGVRLILDTAPAGSVLLSKNFEIISCNQTALSILNIKTRKALSEMEIIDFLPEYQPGAKSSVDLLKEYAKKIMQEGRLDCFLYVRCASGLLIHLEINCVQVTISGKVCYIAHLRELEVEYADSSVVEENKHLLRRLNDVITHMPMMCNTFDKNFRVVDCNRKTLETFGFATKQEFIDRFHETLPEFQPDGRPSGEKAVALITEAFDKGSCSFDWVDQTPKGELLPSRVTLMRFEWKDELFVVAFVQDMREINKIQQDNRDLLQRLQDMFDHMPMICNIFNDEFHIVDCNYKAVETFEMSDKQEFLTRFHETLPEFQPDGRPSKERAKELITEAFEKGFVRFDWNDQKLDGEIIPSIVTLIRFHWKGELFVVAFIQDMREIHAIQRQTKNLMERLDNIIEHMPLLCNTHNKDFDIIDCNQKTLDVFRMKDKQEFSHRFHETFPDFQPDGRPSKEKALEYLNLAMKEGHCEFDWVDQIPGGELMPSKVSMVRFEWEEEFYVVTFTQDLREINRVHEANRNLAYRLQSVIDYMPMMCNTFDKDFKLIDCNYKSVETFGAKDKQDFMNRFHETLPEFQPDGTPSGEKAVGYIAQAFETGFNHFDWVDRKFDGELIPSKVTLVRFEWEGELYVVAFVYDMREFLKAQQEKEALLKQLQDMIDNMPMMCNIFNENYELIDCNHKTVEIYGAKDKQDFINRFHEVSPEFQPDGRPSEEAVIQCISEGFEKGFSQFDWLDRTLYGEELPARITLVRFEWRGAPHVVAFIKDMREFHRAQRAEQLVKERMQYMLNASPMACFVIDEYEEIVEYNREFLALFELEEASYNLENFNDLSLRYQPDGRLSSEKYSELYKKAQYEGVSSHFEWMHVTTAGTLLPCEVTMVQVAQQVTHHEDHNFVIVYIRDLRAIREATAMVENLEGLAYTDPLTKAYNRRYFMDNARKELSRSIAYDIPYSIILADIDKFKSVNDTYGHGVGDEVLKIMVARANNVLKEGTIFARYGGEEFIVMLPGVNMEGAKEIAWRMNKSVSASPFYVETENLKVSVTSSFGVAVRTEDALSLEEIIKNADDALYHAKKTGRNKVVTYDEIDIFTIK